MPRSPWSAYLDGRFDAAHPRRTLWRLLLAQRRDLGAATLYYIVKQAPGWALPLATGTIIDALTPPRAPTAGRTVALTLGIFVAVLVQNIVFHGFFVKHMSRALRQLTFLLRSSLVERVQQLSFSFLDETQSGVLQAKLFRDVDSIEGLCRQLFHSGLNAVLVIAAAVAISLSVQPWMTLYFAVTVPVGIGLLQLFHHQFQKHFAAYREQTEQMNARMGEMLGMLALTRAHGVEHEETRQVRSHLHRLRKTGLRLDIVTELFAASSYVCFNLLMLLCLGFAAWLVLSDRLSVGQAVMFHTYFGMLVGAVGQIMGVFPALAQGVDSVRSLGELMATPEVEVFDGKPAAPPLRGEFVLSGVAFAYPKTGSAAVAALNLHVRAGETIAIVGESGSGKSTLLSLLLGFRHPSAGRISVDGLDLESLDLRAYRRQVGVVPQTTVLFSGSIRDNLTYGLEDWSDAQLWDILARTTLADFVRSLPQGLDTLVGERGAKLSGGQRQRLAIARALVRDPRIIFLDEATSALDTESERLVQQAMEQLTTGRTTFVIAHRFSTIRHAHRIVVMKQGRAVEIGTHDELMARNGAYAALRRLQV
ncbi:MAG: ABC transporter ATP-binding protein [Opitutaceae bacterium]